MANLAIVGSHSTNGVAAIHTELLKTHVVADFAANVSRAIQQQDQRRHAAALAAGRQPVARRGHHRRDRRRLDRRPEPDRQAEAAGRRSAVPAKRSATPSARAKLRFIDWLRATTGQTVDPESIFDSQIKRIHEYKRQLLNALHIVILYNRLRAESEPGSACRARSSSRARRRRLIIWRN